MDVGIGEETRRGTNMPIPSRSAVYADVRVFIFNRFTK